MKTPVQELIEHLETWILEDIHIQDNPMKYEEYMVLHANQMVQVKEHFIRLCKSMLKKEKEVIKNAYIEGCGDNILCESTDKKRAEEYYNETFNTKEK